MSTDTNQTQIQEMIEAWYAALHRGDAPGLAAHYADDVLVASLAPPLWTRGKEQYVQAMTWWFGTFREPLQAEPERLEIVAGDRVAFVNGYSHIRGKKKDGQDMDMRVRLTLCLEKRGGHWLVVADHTSAPFDMTNFAPLLSLPG